jgi:adenylate cyclase
MKFPFHVTLLTLMLGLLLLTGTAIGVISYVNTRNTAEDLSQQVLEHANLGIDREVNNLLFSARDQCELNRPLLEEIDFEDDVRRHRFLEHWFQVMKQYRWFTAVGYTTAGGEGLYVRRDPDTRRLEAIASHPGDGGKWELRFFPAAADYPNRPDKTSLFRMDPRGRPGYEVGKAADPSKSVWTETYMLLTTQGQPDKPGLTCATPVHKKGKLLGVFSVVIDLYKLCDFLEEIGVGQDGFPFIVEYKADRTRSVIAHPDPKRIFKKGGESSGKVYTRLVEAESVDDPRVRALLAELHRHYPNLTPSDLKNKKPDPIRFRCDGVSYRATYRCLSSDLTPDWLICIIVPEESILGRAERGNRQTLILLLGIGLVAVVISMLVAFQVSRPLRRLARETEAIGQFRLAGQPAVRSLVREVDRLGLAVEDMKTSLRSFQKYVPADVVRALLAAGKDAALGGERRTVTIYFSDVADFTAISERLTPEQLVAQLAEFFSAQSEQILTAGGTVDKYIGDAIMAFWGAPATNAGHALAACTAAVRNQQLLRAMRLEWKREGKPELAIRIGLHTGEVIVGNIGSAARLNYTVIGDAVNLASRLEGLNKYYGTEILISEATYLEAKAGVVARPIDWVSVKGKKAGVLVYELLGLEGEADKEIEQLVDAYALALNSYRAQDWPRAITLFEEVLRSRPNDPPAQLMLRRCREYQAAPPPADWDGVRHMTDK